MNRDAIDLTPAGAKLTPRFQPIVVNRAPRHAGSRLRVVLLNAAGGRHFREILDCLKRPPLAGADLILLCEVNSRRTRAAGHDVAHELAEALEMSCAYVPEFGLGPRGGEFELYMGNALLSSVPLEDVVAVAMHRPPTPMKWEARVRRWSREGRPTGLVARVKLGGADVCVGVAHLHSRCSPLERGRQMATYLESFPAAGRAIFGGDLNSTTTELASRTLIVTTALKMIVNPRRFKAPQAYEPLFEHLREHGLAIDGANVADRATFTFSGLIPRWMRPKLDWLAVRELRPITGTAAVVSPRASFAWRRASDHDFVTVDLEL